MPFGAHLPESNVIHVLTNTRHHSSCGNASIRVMMAPSTSDYKSCFDFFACIVFDSTVKLFVSVFLEHFQIQFSISFRTIVVEAFYPKVWVILTLQHKETKQIQCPQYVLNEREKGLLKLLKTILKIACDPTNYNRKKLTETHTVNIFSITY